MIQFVKAFLVQIPVLAVSQAFAYMTDKVTAPRKAHAT